MTISEKSLLAYQLIAPFFGNPSGVKVDGYVTTAYGSDDGVSPSRVNTTPIPREERMEIQTLLSELGFKGGYRFSDENKNTRIWDEISIARTGGIDYVALVDLEKKELRKIWQS